MQVIGFNFTKIAAERPTELKKGPINTNIEFLDLKKESVSLLKDMDAVKISFGLSIDYNENSEEQKNVNNKESKKENKKSKSFPSSPQSTPQAQIKFNGNIVLSVEKDELKDLEKSWKNKELPNATKIPLFNLILKKSSPKALQLQDELNLPSHIPLPMIKSMPQNSNSQ